MKFDYVIGNPPYQKETQDTSDNPVYNEFMDAAYTVGKRIELITPARFLFNVGKTPKSWNEKMLNDEHFKVLNYEPDSNVVFPAINGITGGVAITYYNNDENYGIIGTFNTNNILNEFSKKMRQAVKKQGCISDIMILQNKFDLNKLFDDYPEYRTYKNKKGEVCNRTEKRLVTNVFTTFSIFHDKKEEEDIKIRGIVNSSKRISKYVNKKYVTDNGNLYKYKAIVPKAYGTGIIMDSKAPVIGKPEVLKPETGYTQSYIGIGAFEKEEYALNVIKYLKSKFCRCCVGILKITQDNPPERWAYVPLQDFTEKSNIEWSNKTIAEIDQQFYKNYGLSEEEIEFIETHIKEMK